MAGNKLNEITDKSIDNAKSVCNLKIKEAKAYRDGYIEACSDFRKKVRDEIWKGYDINETD